MPSYTVLYEDNHLIVVFKPAGMLTQGDASGERCLMDEVREYLKLKYRKPGNVYLGMVHRLDRAVCGVVMFARTSKAASRLSEQIRGRSVEKIYRALVSGDTPSHAELVDYLGSDATLGVEISKTPRGELKRSVMRYRKLAVRNGQSLLEIELETGRKHQIRAQLSAAGYPILGDKKYGSRVEWGEGREIALLAKRLSFSHPVRTDDRIVVEVPDTLAPWGKP